MGHSRKNQIAVIDRNTELPKVCVLSGVPATHQIKCLYHVQTEPFQAGVSPMETLLKGILFYFQGVPKAWLTLPVTRSIVIRRNWAVTLCGFVVLEVILVCTGLLGGQSYIDSMPAGVERKTLNDFFIPGLALVGFLIISLTAFIAMRLMPGLTTRIRAERIDETHVHLSGTHPAFLTALETPAG